MSLDGGLFHDDDELKDMAFIGGSGMGQGSNLLGRHLVAGIWMCSRAERSDTFASQVMA